jgi:hypothetical protein
MPCLVDDFDCPNRYERTVCYCVTTTKIRHWGVIVHGCSLPAVPLMHALWVHFVVLSEKLGG